jgi:hypothetical protein
MFNQNVIRNIKISFQLKILKVICDSKFNLETGQI